MIVLLLPRQVIRTILNPSLRVNCFYCDRMYVFLLENQTPFTFMAVNAGNKPITSQTSFGNIGRGSIYQRFKSRRNDSAHDQTYLLETLSLLLARILHEVAGQRELCRKYFRIAMETFDKLRLERRLRSYSVMFASYAF